jgi:hypothetical protein
LLIIILHLCSQATSGITSQICFDSLQNRKDTIAVSVFF